MLIQVPSDLGSLNLKNHTDQNVNEVCIFRDTVFVILFPIHGIVNKAEIDVFLELSCFFDDTLDVGNLISGSSAFSKTSLNIWKFLHI